MSMHVVGLVSDFPVNSRKVVHVKNRPVLIVNHEGEFFAMLNRCPHQGADLCKGSMIGKLEAKEPGEYHYSRQGEILRCPWHGWEFDLRTGQSLARSGKVYVKTYDVAIEQEEKPPAAEMFEVAIKAPHLCVVM